MKLVYTEQAVNSLQEVLEFLSTVQHIPDEKILEIRNQILDAVDALLEHPSIGQEEPFWVNLGWQHRRLVEGHYKIIYRVEDEYIYITDIFDSLQDPDKMKG
ncbi:MAG TPA: type II toxin-antitoxin system RelE/ParE family toxin [Williamwhitmania sp.]|nr:type II toxin-antitoxin system RelE/ParE family toxin [Williamwhitmania sp.]